MVAVVVQNLRDFLNLLFRYAFRPVSIVFNLMNHFKMHQVGAPKGYRESSGIHKTKSTILRLGSVMLVTKFS